MLWIEVFKFPPPDKPWSIVFKSYWWHKVVNKEQRMNECVSGSFNFDIQINDEI